jgi:hypothetical protein
MSKRGDNMAWQDVLKNITDESYNSGNSGLYDSETARANKVIAERKAQGLDVSAQLKYLQQLNEANMTGQVKREAYSSGADPNNIDMGYVQARAAGTQQQYVNNVLGNNVPAQTAQSVQFQPRVQSQSNAQPNAQPSQSTYAPPDFSGQVKNIYDPLITSNLANLKAAYDKARGNISAQTPLIQQQARSARTANETDYIKSLPELYRAMEAAGQRGGQNITGNIALQTTRGQNLGQINQTEMNNLAALQKAIADLNAEQPLKEQSVEQQLRSEQAQALMDAQKYGMDYALRMADLTGNVEVAPGVSVPTLQAQRYLSDDAYRNRAFDYGVSQDALNRSDTLTQRNIDNAYRQGVFDYQRSRDAVADTQWQQQMKLDLRRQSFNEAQQSIENSLAQKRISQDEANQALQWAKFNADQDPNSVDNQLKRQTLDINAQAKADSTLNNTIQRLDSLYTYKDVTGQTVRNSNYSDAQLRAAIIGLGLDDNQTDALLLRYGLPINQ